MAEHSIQPLIHHDSSGVVMHMIHLWILAVYICFLELPSYCLFPYAFNCLLIFLRIGLLCSVSKKTTPTLHSAHYNFNAHQLILVTFSRHTAEWICCRMV